MPLTTRWFRSGGPVAGLTPGLQVAAVTTAALTLLAAVLAAVAWTAPVREVDRTGPEPAQRMTFGYSAAVPRSAAYDSTTATSPQPIFRRLADDVDVQYDYVGPPGRIVVDAIVSTGSGWSSTVSLETVTSFDDRVYAGTTRLDLSALEDRADAAATATGVPSGQVLVTLAPTVTSAGGATFSPTLGLRLEPLVLSLSGGPASLAVLGSASTRSEGESTNTLSFLGVQATVPLARSFSVALLLLCLLAAAGVVVAAGRTRPVDEVEAIQRRWSSLLVRVLPVDAPPGRSVVDVTGAATLIRLAERYGLLVLHWSDGDGETYVVQDDATTYRYRARAAGPAAPSGETAEGTSVPRPV